MNPNALTTTYWLDGKDCIISVSGPWDEFAQENEGIHLSADEIQGRPIWDYVTGDVTRMWLHTLLKLSIVSKKALERPYRCDSPELKRYMRMKITVEKDGLLKIDHILQSVEKRLIPLRSVHTSKSPSKMIKMKCSICGRIDDGVSWEEPQFEHTNGFGELTVAYTVCCDCRVSLPKGCEL